MERQTSIRVSLLPPSFPARANRLHTGLACLVRLVRLVRNRFQTKTDRVKCARGGMGACSVGG
eukprot:2481583-Rhodomonas_salina.1